MAVRVVLLRVLSVAGTMAVRVAPHPLARPANRLPARAFCSMLSPAGDDAGAGARRSPSRGRTRRATGRAPAGGLRYNPEYFAAQAAAGALAGGAARPLHQGRRRPAAGGEPHESARQRSSVPVGARVLVVQKEHQRTGERTEGRVLRLLTKSGYHPRGIKVMLESGVVGRVHELCGGEEAQPQSVGEQHPQPPSAPGGP